MTATVAGVPSASAYSVLFGKFDKYIIRDVLGMTMVRYNELYMPNHQVGFQAYLRTDGNRLQQKAFSLLQQHS
jgi:HK97 family phage major capsid protein